MAARKISSSASRRWTLWASSRTSTPSSSGRWTFVSPRSSLLESMAGSRVRCAWGITTALTLS
eukprot:1149026-Heterocapsa_arctica.AAC.1